MITTFISYLTLNRGLSVNTAKAYGEALRDFAQFINQYHAGTTWRTVDKAMIDSYVEMMATEGAAAATIKQHISALRCFYKTCMALGGITKNPARYVSTPKLGKQLPKTIETDAIRKALESATVNQQAKAAIAIIFETGIRLQELLDLRANDIDAAKQSIRINGKGNKQRIVYYGDLTKRYGKFWHGAQHTQRGVRHLVYDALRDYSKAEQLSPHALRHTFATQLLNNGMPLEIISKLMGHKNTVTTEIYANLAMPTTQEAYKRCLPTL